MRDLLFIEGRGDPARYETQRYGYPHGQHTGARSFPRAGCIGAGMLWFSSGVTDAVEGICWLIRQESACGYGCLAGACWHSDVYALMRLLGLLIAKLLPEPVHLGADNRRPWLASVADVTINRGRQRNSADATEIGLLDDVAGDDFGRRHCLPGGRRQVVVSRYAGVGKRIAG